MLQLAEISYTNTQQVLLVVYEDFEAEMWYNIKMLTFQTTKKEFIWQMKNQYHNWKEIFSWYKFVNSQVKSQQAYVNFFYLAFSEYVLSFFQLQRNWSLQKYNSYWKNKIKLSDQLIIKSIKSKSQSQLSVFKQSLMIIAEFAILN